MKLTYLPDDRLFVHGDPDKPILARLTIHGTLSVAEEKAFGRLLAAAPRMLSLLDRLADIEPDDFGDRTVSPEAMDPIWEVLNDFRDHPLHFLLIKSAL